MTVRFTLDALAVMERLGLTCDRVVTALERPYNPTRTDVRVVSGTPVVTVVEWLSSDLVLLVAGTPLDPPVPSSFDRIRVLEVTGAAIVRPNLPRGRIRRDTDAFRAHGLFARSFAVSGPGLPALVEMDRYLAWFREDIARVLNLPAVRSNEPPDAERLSDKERAHSVADSLVGCCTDFLSLLAAKGDSEKTIHQWLLDPRHHVFLDTSAIEVRSKVPFGSKVSDFVVRRSDETYLLVEIETATARIFRSDNAEPHSGFTHACTQVRDWQRYIHENLHTVREEQAFPGIYRPKGMIVMGRAEQIAGREACQRWRALKNEGDPLVFTYDELCARVETLAGMLRQFARS